MPCHGGSLGGSLGGNLLGFDVFPIVVVREATVTSVQYAGTLMNVHTITVQKTIGLISQARQAEADDRQPAHIKSWTDICNHMYVLHKTYMLNCLTAVSMYMCFSAHLAADQGLPPD